MTSQRRSGHDDRPACQAWRGVDAIRPSAADGRLPMAGAQLQRTLSGGRHRTCEARKRPPHRREARLKWCREGRQSSAQRITSGSAQRCWSRGRATQPFKGRSHAVNCANDDLIGGGDVQHGWRDSDNIRRDFTATLKRIGGLVPLGHRRPSRSRHDPDVSGGLGQLHGLAYGPQSSPRVPTRLFLRGTKSIRLAFGSIYTASGTRRSLPMSFSKAPASASKLYGFFSIRELR
jgi:hypothetical protein